MDPPAAGPRTVSAVDTAFRPVRSGNAFENAVQRILQAIRLGLIGSGDRLPPERELAARLGVSRVTLREALRALQEAGYVESRRGRYGGTFVLARPPGRRSSPRRVARAMGASLEDALTLRQVLECGAAEAAAGRRVPTAERDHLRASLAAVAAAAPADYRRLDSRLHLAVAELTTSPSLVSAVADVRARLNDLLDAIPLLERNLAHFNVQHAAVVAAVLARRPEAARRAMEEHLEGTAALLRGFLGPS